MDFYSEDENASFGEQIKEHIAHQVKQEIFKDFRKQLTEDFNTEVIKEIQNQKKFFISNTMNELILTQKIKSRYVNEPISIAEFIKTELINTQLESNGVKNYIDTETKKAASTLAKDLKDRYDLLFASQLVAKMNESGMLKENIANMLLEKKDG